MFEYNYSLQSPILDDPIMQSLSDGFVVGVGSLSPPLQAERSIGIMITNNRRCIDMM